MSKTLDKKLLLWQTSIKQHYQLNKTLKIDKDICGLLLKNKAIFGKMITNRRVGRTTYPLWTTVSGKNFRMWLCHNSEGRKSYLASAPCLGENEPGYFAYEVKKMKYLSQFLASLAAWRAKRNIL